MENLFNLFKGFIITHPKYSGVVCGYNHDHFILAVETKDDKNFFRKMENPHIMEEYKDTKYRYVFENESEILKQMKSEQTKNLS
jgi:hypothetical protein